MPSWDMDDGALFSSVLIYSYEDRTDTHRKLAREGSGGTYGPWLLYGGLLAPHIAISFSLYCIEATSFVQTCRFFVSKILFFTRFCWPDLTGPK